MALHHARNSTQSANEEISVDKIVANLNVHIVNSLLWSILLIRRAYF
ncbi:hypothetical protein GPAL_0667 [Glaciecola pallidula DSM 14239 = ACAM 615]|uniref:Uncharacterized protein n=1 Tax=Brumicola pallidula DSM 14239 = ACAM 615 TaxID=1121922 RepID=K6ZB03_9ALTE|nr:hypothetical protein GPAL_0667 [Glaciecola pallidula DSM 14239 = ACAM 615]